MDSSTGRELSAGIAQTENKLNRLKSITHRFAVASGAVLSVLVYDDDNIIWRKDISTTQYNSPTAVNASPNTITFSQNGEKGISGSLGNSLVVYVSSSSATTSDYPMIDRSTGNNISIVYDQF